MSGSSNQPTDFRRPMILVFSIVLLTTFAVIFWNEGQRGEHKMLANAAGRVGLVMAGLWIAWPSLLRPINWLPPGIAVLGVDCTWRDRCSPRPRHCGNSVGWSGPVCDNNHP